MTDPRDPASSDASSLDQEALELAALYALEALGASEMEAVERERHAQAAFWAEVRSLRDAAAGLAESGPRVRPRRDLWPAIRARVPGARSGEVLQPEVPPAASAQVWKRWRKAEPGPAVVGAQSTPFEPTGIEGIRVRRLSVDEDADRVTMLVRMDAGTRYPAHRHGGVEECFVLEGDLEIGEAGSEDTLEMRAGDFQRMDSGSTHAVQATRGGCLLLITSSRHDELLG